MESGSEAGSLVFPNAGLRMNRSRGFQPSSGMAGLSRAPLLFCTGKGSYTHTCTVGSPCTLAKDNVT